MPLEFKKSISDPIYGTVPLTELELKIIDTQVFQRLRHVEQLGLANYVFPSADYSRFAHSIGACHTMGQILSRLEAQKAPGDRLTDVEFQFRRVAMLLHDIGHYFMSHAAEYALEAYQDAIAAASLTPGVTSLGKPTTFDYIDHEQVGKLILESDPELSPIIKRLQSDGKAADRLAAMFKGAFDETYWSLVSSELDADRLDYLMRSSQATGLPYGHFDRDYIIQNLVTDKKGRVCLHAKAIRAADHYVMCRSFDYLQVIFHKTIVGFEEMLKRCIRHLLETGTLKLGKADLEASVKSNDWLGYTDAWLMDQIRSISAADPIVLAMRDRLIKRKPAPMMWSHEELIGTRKEEAKLTWHRQLGHYFDDGGPAWAKNCLYWFKHFRPTDASPFQTTFKKEAKDDENKEKSIHILGRTGSAKPLTEWKESFTRHLSNQAYVMVRVYYIGPPSDEAATKVEFEKLMKSLKFVDGIR